MTLPTGIQQELDAAVAKTPESERHKIVIAAYTIAMLLSMGPHRAELYMAPKYKETT